MKYFLLGVIVFICGYIGYGLSKFYIARLKLFTSLINFSEKLDTDINFGKAKLLKIIEEFNSNSKELKKILDSYTLCLNEGKTCSEEIFKDVKILKDEEKHVILCFFSELGKLDVYNQTKQIENSKIKFQEIVNSCTEEKKKYGTLYLKLGIILGLLIALILF